MCGLGAIVALQSLVDPLALARMGEMLVHRGPDDRGQWLPPDRNIGLVHTRLSIVDLHTGRQPLHNEDESLHLIVNGEFYDFECTRAALSRRGHLFRTASDSEILVHLYEESGYECVHELRGEFAFCLWDERKRVLWAARDRFGVKPLFYTIWNGTLLLASEIKALFAAGVPARWDLEATLDQLFVCLAQSRTPYAGVFQIPPGHMLIAAAGEVRLRKYWDMDYPQEDSEALCQSESQYVERLRASLVESVQLRLRADVPVGCFLSGGLDSSSVLSIASRYAQQRLNAFTVSFADSPYDERPYAETMARFTGANFLPTEVRDADLAVGFKQALWHGEMFALNGHGVARYLHSRAIHDAGWKVVLSGSGSDDVLGGYPSAREDMLNQRNLERTEPPGLLRCVAAKLGFIPAWMGRLARDRSAFFLFLSREMLELFERRNPYDAFVSSVDYRSQLAQRDPLIQSLYLWTKAFLGSYELCAERLEMAHGLEVRLPFLDDRLFQVVRTLPPRLLIKGMQEKYVLRQAVRPYLPELIYSRSKHSFTAPPIMLDNSSQLYQLLQDSLRSVGFRQLPFFEPSSVVEFLDTLADTTQSVRLSLDGVMTMMLSAALLQECYAPGA